MATVTPEKVAEFQVYIDAQPDGLSGKADEWALRRYLVARQMNIPKAYEQMREYYAWRERAGMDSRPKMGSPENPYVYSIRGYDCVPDLDPDLDVSNVPPFVRYCGGGCFHKTAKDGTPLIIELLGKFDCKKLSASATPESFLEHHNKLSEFLIGQLMVECSKKAGHNIDKQTVIFDCTGMGMHQFHMPVFAFLRAIADFDSKYYPERLQRLYLVHAPPLFTKVWNMIKKWLDKGILEKIFILGSDSKDVLLKYIDAANLPASLGGSCTCSHMPNGCVPLFAPPTAMASQSESSLDYTGHLKDSKDPHVFEITVPMDELVVSAAPSLIYKFRSAKKPVLFQVRHRQWGKSDETTVLAASSVDSHHDIVTGKIPAQPGFYIFEWTKIVGKGFAGLSISAIAIEYSVDLQFDESGVTAAAMNPTSPPPSALGPAGGDDDDDDGDDDNFLDAEE